LSIVGHYSAQDGMRAGFEYYRSFPQDAKDNKGLAATAKLTMPVPVLTGEVYPALGAQLRTNLTSSYIQPLATTVHGIIVPLSGHWTLEKQSDFIAKQLNNFFGNSTNGTNWQCSL
jgi:pimeloyl-ACP methyl ester carboxylesterase